MKIAVRYISRSGNTEKLAKAIAQAVGAEAISAEQPLTEPVEVLFVGGALYAGSVDNRLKVFLEGLAPEEVKQVVFFSTAAGPKTAHSKAAAALTAKGITVAAQTYHCRGKFLLANKGRPNGEDLKRAAEFARQFI